MWVDNSIFKEDLDNVIHNRNIPWENVDGKTILVTGATGLIGYNLVNALLYYGLQNRKPPKVIALVHHIEKAKKLFQEQIIACGSNLKIIASDICEALNIPESIHYIIHAASQTDSKFFVTNPVETLQTSIIGTKNILELARKNFPKSVVYLSSMEVYGYPQRGKKVSETDIGNFQPTEARNSYPLGKQISECMCCAYAQEYGIQTKIIRLTQTMGPGVDYADNRAFMEFVRCVIEKKDIILKTKGETERSYLYTADAVAAILIVMLKGESGQIYNVANENTYCSIMDMARLMARVQNLSVEVYLDNIEKYGYAKTLYMNLDTTKVQKLGWHPQIGLSTMIERLITVVKDKDN